MDCKLYWILGKHRKPKFAIDNDIVGNIVFILYHILWYMISPMKCHFNHISELSNMTGFPRHRMKIREERVFIEEFWRHRTFLETLKQVKRDDFVSLRTAIEDHQSNYFFLCYIFFSWDMENRLPCSDRQKWKPPS